MANILHICTATPQLFMVHTQDAELGFQYIVDGQKHASEINRGLATLKQNTDLDSLDAVACSMGPGSYTGLRVGMAFAKGLCIALDLELLLIDSLQILHEIVAEENPSSVWTSIDARRMEVFAELWSADGKPILGHQAVVLDETTVLDPYRDTNPLLIGSGAQKSQTFFLESPIRKYDSREYLEALVRLGKSQYADGNFADIVSAKPYYGKEPYVTTPKKRIWK